MIDAIAAPLRSKRLSYRPLVDESLLDPFHALCTDAHVRRYLLDGEIVERLWAMEAIAASATSIAEMGVGLWLVERDGRWVGFCGFRSFDDLTPEPQLLYALTEAHTGRGYATEMTDALLRLAWHGDWTRVVSAVDAPNRASLRVLDKNGFSPCGYVPGAFGDIVLLDRFRHDRPAPALVPGSCSWLTIASTWDGRLCGEDERVEVTLEADDDEIQISIDAPFHGDPPPEAPAGSTPHLWDHEVVEVMFLGEDDRYLEIELSPHGHYLALLLHGRRRVVHQGMVMYHQATIDGARWRGRTRVPLGWLPHGLDRLNAYAMHGSGDGRRYLAWRPTEGERPDFHRLGRFGRLDHLPTAATR